VTQSVPLGTFALGMALSPDGSQIYMPGETSLAILDVSTLALSIAPLAVGKIAVAPDGTVYGDNTSSIVVIDPVLWTVTATYAADDANFFALSLDGMEAACTCSTVKVP
jgi:DNA-binding beta-propeller fold protein YncE